MATNGDSHSTNDDPERERVVRELVYLYHGRFTESEARSILEHVNWNKGRAVDFVLKSDPVAVRRITGKSEDVITELRTDPSVIEELKNGIKKATRQFACEPCDRFWWRKVPLRKQVSECMRCKQKYDPVPREYEWGWATYRCECGHEFSGSGQKNTSAPCFQCDESVYPSEIRPPMRRGRRKTNNTHCCDAPDCTGFHDPVTIHDVDPDRVYDDGTDNRSPPGSSRSEPRDNGSPRSAPRSDRTEDVTHQFGQANIGGISRRTDRPDQEELYSRNQQAQNSTPNSRGRRNSGGIHTCVSPQSREGKKKVVYPSERHNSTGSTVATFLTQSDDVYSYVPSLPSIPEGRRGGRHRGGYRR